MSEINKTSPIKEDTTAPYNSEVSKSPPQQSTSSIPLDSLTSSPSEELYTQLSVAGVSPQLEIPGDKDISLRDFLKKFIEVTRGLKNQLSASKTVDIETRISGNQNAALQAQILNTMFANRQQAIDQLSQQIDQILKDLQELNDEMEKQTKGQQDAIDKLNSGNELEKQKHAELTKAYDDYIKNLKSIGAVDKGNGTYEIPEESTEKYNEFTKAYQGAVDNYNVYWTERQKEIDQYNSKTVEYNEKAAENNQAIDQMINQYNLADYMAANNIPPLPTQPTANTRDTSKYLQELDKPSTIDNTSATIQTYTPPSYMYTTASSGPPKIAKLGDFSSRDVSNLKDGIYQTLYDEQIATLDQEINTNITYWAFLQTMSLLQDRDTTKVDPILNIKPLVSLILPTAWIEPKPNQLRGLSSIGLGNQATEKILARSIISEVIAQSNLKISVEKQTRLVDQLLILVVGLLGNNSLQALFPGLSVISQTLASLPKDSPVLSLLFSVSFVNRVLELVELGLTQDALQTFIADNPEWASLTAIDQNTLAAALNVGLLLTAGKLLEANIGLSGLMTQLLLPLLSSELGIDPAPIFAHAIQESIQNLKTVEKELSSHYLNQGYSQETAAFLAETGVRLINNGLLTPTAPSPSTQSIDVPLLINSIKADLILSNGPSYPLSIADATAREAVALTLSEGPFYTTNQFFKLLETQLADLGVKGEPGEIVRYAVVIPTVTSLPTAINIVNPQTGRPLSAAINTVTPQAISTLSTDQPVGSSTPTATPFPSAAAATNVPFQTLSSKDISSRLNTHIQQLITPIVGFNQGKQIAEEVIQTLYGAPSVGSPTPSETKELPLSYIRVLKHQLSILKEKQEQNFTAALTEDFKETIKTSLNFYAFSLKLMDPLAAYTMIGIMYSRHEPKGGALMI